MKRNIASSLLVIQCLFMEKINYQKYFENIIKNLQNSGKKPKLLLHACCGPCFTFPYELVKDYFEITIIYNNSNIYPEEEYYRRKNELKKYLKDIDANIEVIELPYDNETYNLDLEPLKDEPEGGARCYRCYEKRLSYGYKYASEHGFDYYGSVMSISRYKNAQYINQIGEKLQEQYPNVKWLYADFKKNDGYQKSLQIVRKHEMYFQEYCGCKYSYAKWVNKKRGGN